MKAIGSGGSRGSGSSGQTRSKQVPLYSVDVKAVINLTVEAARPEEARRAADDYVETSLSPEPEEVAGYNSVLDEEGVGGGRVGPGGYSWAVGGDRTAGVG